MKEAFDKLRLNNANKLLLVRINSIIEDYQKQGYVLTLRQLYYQLVSRDIIANKISEYMKLSTLLTKARLGGIVDWEAIEDRLRIPRLPYHADGIADALNDIINQYRLDRMKNQDVYIEVWSEKDALSGIFSRVTDEYHVRLVINRGYASITAMYNAYNRFKKQIENNKKCFILYFGDHDPSGLDMIRDIRTRLIKFVFVGMRDKFADWYEARTGEGIEEVDKEENIKDYSKEFKEFSAEYLEVIPIGLTMEQIRQYSPPPNPAKEKDPRSGWYKEHFGSTSWEVDALPPEVLTKLLTKAIKQEIDIGKFKEMVEGEQRDIEEFKIIQGKYIDDIG